MKKLSGILLVLLCIIAADLKASDSFSLNGYYKSFFSVYDYSDAFYSIYFDDKPAGLVNNRLRLDSRMALSDRVNLNISYSLAPRIQDNTLSLISHYFESTGKRRYRIDDFDQRLYPKKSEIPGSFAVFHNLDRLKLSISATVMDINIGRQAIAWGSAKVINPTDIIAPYSFDELDSEERIGVDAIRMRVPVGFMGEFDAGYIFGKDGEFKNSAFFLRSKTYIARTDLSLLALGFQENLLLGFDMTRAVGGAGCWIEAAYVFPKIFADNDLWEEDEYFRGTIGLDYSLTGKMYGYIEYHYNQPGKSKAENYPLMPSSIAYREGSVYLLGQHYLMPGASYQITPLITGSGQIIWNLNDWSMLLAPTIEYNIAENFYLAGGFFIGVGKKMAWPTYSHPTTVYYQSEFGGYADSFYASFRIYF